MKTYEYTVNPATPAEFTFLFDAESRVEADALVKQRTKRSAKILFVAAHSPKVLQKRAQRNHTSKVATENFTFLFECPMDGHRWRDTDISSHTFKQLCPLCKTFHKSGKPVEPVTYKHVLFAVQEGM